MPSRPLAKLTLLATSSLTVMAGAIVAPSLPAIGEALHGASELRVKLILTLPALAIALVAPMSGLVIDRFGRKPTLLAGLVLYAAAGSTGLYLSTLGGILIGRALLGLAVAGMMTASTTLIGDLFHGDERRKMMGWQASAMAFGGVVFMIGGGQLAQLHWRGPFGVYLLSAGLLPVVLMLIPEPRRPHHTDAESATLVPPEDGVEHLGDPVPWGTVILNYATGFVGMAMFFLVPVQVPFLLRDVAGAEGGTVGFAIACSTFMAAVFSLLYGRAKARLSYHAIFAIAFGTMSVAYVTIGMAESLTAAVLGLVICGVGFGWVMPNLNLCLLDAAPPRARGKLVGGLTATLFLGQFLSPILAQPILQRTDAGGAFRYSAAAMVAIATGFAVLAIRSRPARGTLAPANSARP